MQKSAPSPGRILVMVGFALSCFGLLLFLWLAFGGPVPLKPKGYRVTVSFTEAGQLAQEADVRISGVSVGKVKDVASDQSTGRSDATIELDKRYAPLPRDSKAILRQKTLLGETYVELTPGHRSAGGVPDGGRLSAGQVSPTVELDEIFRAFDAKTRAAFRDWMQQQALAADGRGRDISDAIGNLRPFAEDTNVLLKILNGQAPTVRALVRDSGTVFSALSERDGQLRGLIENSNRVFATTAQRNRELQAAFRALPTFERESQVTLERLTAFARNADPLVTQLRPAARQLSPTLKDLAALSPDLKAFFRNLDPAITASKDGLPALEAFLEELRPTLGELDPPLRQIAPALDGLGQYKSELTAFLANVPAATQAVTSDSKGNRIHYLRTTNPLNPENLAVYPKRLPTNRTNPYAYPRLFDQLPRGMDSYETRQCGRGGMPTVADTLTNLIPAPLRDNIVKYAFGGDPATTPAPPCRQQAKFPVFGEVTQYPHVRENRLLTGAPFSGGG
ncbi:MAG TPA: MlaD family protein [Solirubrobacteraceae bacterium]|nr:MlaD family protein [Solirubrobacteraceae bacterium]